LLPTQRAASFKLRVARLIRILTATDCDRVRKCLIFNARFFAIGKALITMQRHLSVGFPWILRDSPGFANGLRVRCDWPIQRFNRSTFQRQRLVGFPWILHDFPGFGWISDALLARLWTLDSGLWTLLRR